VCTIARCGSIAAHCTSLSRTRAARSIPRCLAGEPSRRTYVNWVQTLAGRRSRTCSAPLLPAAPRPRAMSRPRYVAPACPIRTVFRPTDSY
jgi:hypothetical protein